MAAYGGIATGGAAGDVTSLSTASLNVTGSDLCLIGGVVDGSSQTQTYTLEWGPAPPGNNPQESMTGTIATNSYGTYMDITLQYLDDPTADNTVLEATWTTGMADILVMAAFFTGAGDIVATDYDADGFPSTGTSLSSTVPNAATNDIIMDFMGLANQVTLTEGANQTTRGTPFDVGSYMRGGVSTQAGADGGVMSWTFTNPVYGGAHVALRIPDVNAGGGGGPSTPQGLLGIMQGINVQRSTRLGGELEQ